MRVHPTKDGSAFQAVRRACALFVFAFVFGLSQSAGAEDRWFAPDKALHFGVSAGLSSAGYALSSLVLKERPGRIATGSLCALVPGAAKELFDAAGYGDPSWKDFAWDAGGTLVGVSLAWLLDVALTPAKPEQPSAVAHGLILSW